MSKEVCIFEGCDKIQKTKIRGLCAGHEWQYQHGQDLRPLIPYGTSDIGVEGYRRCTRCKKVKEETEFYRRKNSKLRGHCKRCAIEMTQEATRRSQEARNAD